MESPFGKGALLRRSGLRAWRVHREPAAKRLVAHALLRHDASISRSRAMSYRVASLLPSATEIVCGVGAGVAISGSLTCTTSRTVPRSCGPIGCQLTGLSGPILAGEAASGGAPGRGIPIIGTSKNSGRMANGNLGKRRTIWRRCQGVRCTEYPVLRVRNIKHCQITNEPRPHRWVTSGQTMRPFRQLLPTLRSLLCTSSSTSP